MATAKTPELGLWKSKDEKKASKDGGSESTVKPNLMPSKKVPPPVKVKTLFTKLNKVGEEQVRASQDLVKPASDRTNDAVIFDILTQPSEKLKHLTADRPRANRQRPPTHTRASAAPQDAKRSMPPLAPAKVPHPYIQLSKPSPNQRCQSTAGRPGMILSHSANKTQRQADWTDSIVGLQAELQSLHLSCNLMKNQYLRDVIDLKEEIAEERTKWKALQVEVENLKKTIKSQ
ncbi:SH3 domain-containing protein 21 isoform X2 [Narcine bancroftii]|uniref:SH3 domain-containing protein 21 isoform X2 n=1 Tax=Narcine bancroftii TaxID=1343680 RepID=UPI003831BF22